MAYNVKYPFAAPSVAGPVALTSVADVLYFPVPYQMKVERLEALVTTAVTSTGAVVLSFYQRPTHGSTVAQVLLGTLSIPATATVGQCYYKDITDANSANPVVQAGQELVVNVSTAAAGGGAGGNVIPMAVVAESPDVALNQVNLILSS